MSSISRTLLGATACAALLLGACGDDDDAGGGAQDTTTSTTTTEAPDDTAGALGPNELAIESFAFLLQPVDAGATVSFANRDDAPHTLTAEDGSFDTGGVGGGDSATFTAPGAGSYAVFCSVHPNIVGTLVVE